MLQVSNQYNVLLLVFASQQDAFIVPILKYVLFVSCSLLALLFVAEQTLAPAPATASSASTSLDVLRKMANHGETRGFAPLADAGLFIPMPEVVVPAVLASANQPSVVANPADIAIAARSNPAETPAMLNAQARAPKGNVVKRPSRSANRIVSKRPNRSNSVYVENVVREPAGFFGAFQSW